MALADEPERNDDVPLLTVEREGDAGVVRIAEDARERAAAVDGLVRLDRDGATEVPLEVHRPHEWPGDAGRRDLDGVAVEVGTKDLGDGGAELVVDPLRVVDE